MPSGAGSERILALLLRLALSQQLACLLQLEERVPAIGPLEVGASDPQMIRVAGAFGDGTLRIFRLCDRRGRRREAQKHDRDSEGSESHAPVAQQRPRQLRSNKNCDEWAPAPASCCSTRRRCPPFGHQRLDSTKIRRHFSEQKQYSVPASVILAAIPAEVRSI